ncbi:MAG TPA: hypothetical protein VF598_12250, partial [Hymenobacter sp.]
MSQRHTQKAQVIVRKSDKRLLCTAFAKGKTHDFALFKNSRLPLFPPPQLVWLTAATRGYKGLQTRKPPSGPATSGGRTRPVLAQALRYSWRPLQKQGQEVRDEVQPHCRSLQCSSPLMKE